MQKIFLLLLITWGFLSGCSNTASMVDIGSKQGMVAIAPNIYVNAEMHTGQRKQFLQTVKHSKGKVARFFGEMHSSPEIYACSNKQCFSKYGGIPAKAKSFDDDKILLSLRALDKTTLTHELVHVEFHKRLGASHAWNKVPMWFDEGLAILVCKDPNYAEHVAMLPLNKLVSHNQWIDAVNDSQPAYNIARQAVESWYNVAGAEGLQTIITRLQRGGEFSLGRGESSLRDSSHLQLSKL